MRSIARSALVCWGALLAFGCQEDDSVELGSNEAALIAPDVQLIPGETPYILPIPTANLSCGSVPRCSTVGPGVDCCLLSNEVATRPDTRLGTTDLFPYHLGIVPYEIGPEFTWVDYRIPSIVATDTGVLVAFAEKRYRSTAPTYVKDGETRADRDSGVIEIVYRVRTTDGVWGPQKVLCSREDETCGNPTAVFESSRRRIHVVMNSNHRDASLPGGTIGAGSRRTLVATSWQSGDDIDGDLTFTTPVDVFCLTSAPTTKWDAVGPGTGIQLSDGRLLFSATGRNLFWTPLAQADGEGCQTSQITYTNTVGTGSPLKETTIVQRSDGSLLRNDRAEGSLLSTFRRAASHSLNASFSSWTPYTQVDQPLTPGHYCSAHCGNYDDTCPEAFAGDEGCGKVNHVHAAMGRYNGGPTLQRLFFTNPGHTLNRWGMAVRLSYDEGATWPVGRELVGKDLGTGYSSASKTTGSIGNGIAVLYERGTPIPDDETRQHIAFDWVSLAWVLCGRSEPLYAGGNSWMGAFDRATIRTSGSHTYYGTSGGQPVSVTTSVTSLTESGQFVTLTKGGVTTNNVLVLPNAPGRYFLPSGQSVDIDPWQWGKPWCEPAPI